MTCKYKILHIGDLSTFGGVQTIMTSLVCKSMTPFEFHVFSPKKINSFWADKLTTNHVHFSDGSSQKNWEIILAEYAAKNHIDLAHFHYPWRKAKSMLKAANVKIIIEHDHGFSWQRSGLQILKSSIRGDSKLVNGIIAVSDASFHMLTKYLKYDPKKVTQIYNGVDFQSQENYVSMTKPAKKIITTVSRLVTLKNIDALIMAIPYVIANRTDVQFWIIGDGPLQNRLETLTRTLNVSEYVKFWGNQTEVSKFLHASDLFVLPTLKDPLSTALIEAGYCGLPLIASNIDGNPEIISANESGVLLETEVPISLSKSEGDPMPHYVIDGSTKRLKKPLGIDPHKLAKVIIALLSNTELCKKMGENAKKRSLELFNLERFQHEIANYYLQKLAGN